MRLRILILALIAVFPAHGVPAADDFARQSPCLFETVFPIGDPSRWKRIASMERFTQGKPLGLKTWPRHMGTETSIPEWYELGRYTCDGVSLREEVTKHGTVWEEPGLRVSDLVLLPNGNYQVTLEATLYNPKGNQDRTVTLDYVFLDNADQQVGTANRTYKLVAKAKSGENADVLLLLTPDEMQRITKLRLSMTTKTD